MRVAVPTQDGKSISRHFGRSKSFFVFEVEGHETGLRDWKFDDFRTALRTGKRPDGTKLRGQYMPWRLISQSSDEDLGALWAYIRSVEPRPSGGR